MTNLLRLKTNSKKIILNNWLILLYFTIIFFLLIINSLHFSYPDEFDNIVGGFFIDHGKLPYIGFFTQHGPFAYFYAALIDIFAGQSFVKFRILYNLSYLIFYILFFRFILKRFGSFEAKIILWLLGFVVIGATFDWGHMLLSDTVAGVLLIPAYITLFFIILRHDILKLTDIILISILCFLTFLTSITYIYAVGLIYLFSSIYYLRQERFRFFNLKSLKVLLAITTPALIFLIYLLITRSLSDYYYQAIYFNQHYYITTVDGARATNPLRFAIAIFWNFFQNFQVILAQTKDLNFGFPFAQTLALGDFLTILYLLINRRYKLALYLSLVMIYLCGRGNPYTTAETDYQALPYHYLSLFNGLFLLNILWQNLKLNLDSAKKIVYGAFLLFLGSYMIFLSIFLFSKFADKAYQKYMGTQSLIYDRPLVANTLNELLGPNDYYYIGPFAFEEYFYMKEGKMASKYFITIPAMDQSDKIKSGLMSDIQKNKPKIVVFDTGYYIFGMAPGTYLVSYLRQNYFTLVSLRADGYKFDVKVGNFGNYDFQSHFFFEKSRQDEILNDLVKAGLITQPLKPTTTPVKHSTQKA